MITRAIARPLAGIAANQWTCAACTVGITSSRAQKLIPQAQRRTKFSVPTLNFTEEFAEGGISGLFTVQGYGLGWVTYQDFVVSKLNTLIKDDSALANRDVKDLAIRLAKNPATVSTFNHASMAHNNHFFYQQFAPKPRPLSLFPDLESSLVKAFGSIDTLKKTFIDTAAGMFGPGFVWLVWTREGPNDYMGGGTWKILCTYNGGTPYPEAGFMQQGLDMNTNNAESYQRYQSGLGGFGTYSNTGRDRAKLPPGGTSIMPVLCVSVWEHTYIYDFGLDGKDEYLASFWEVIDWQSISNRAPKEAYSSRGRL